MNVKEPRTEAGKKLDDELFSLTPPPDDFTERVALRRSHRAQIATIEAEARAAALSAVEEAVKGLDAHQAVHARGRISTWRVLLAIAALQEPTPNEPGKESRRE